MPDTGSTLKYAAGNYLRFWIKIDQVHYTAFQEHFGEDTVRQLLIAYKAIRTIPGDIAQFVRAVGRGRDTKLTPQRVASVLGRISDRLEQQYGRRCVSAVSKACWMIHRHPVAIYDSYALGGFKSLRGGRVSFHPGDYSAFYELWRET